MNFDRIHPAIPFLMAQFPDEASDLIDRLPVIITGFGQPRENHKP
jgi:hypothetical protein